MLCCVAVHLQLQGLGIGVTTNAPNIGLLQGWRKLWGFIDNTDKCWYITIGSDDCEACHKGQERLLQWVLDHSPGNTFGLCVLSTGELHLYHNGRDVGVVWEGLPTDQPLWGFVYIPGWKVEANYIIPKGEAVTCGEVVCGVMFVSCNICACYCHLSYFALHMAVV